MTNQATAQRSYVRGRSVDRSTCTHLPIAVSRDVDALKDIVFSHAAVSVLKQFGENLQSRPLQREEIRVLLASEGAFVLEVPPGIVALTSRITDETFATDPFQSTGRAARILFAAVDEYGLNDIENGLLPSHHQLYADMAAHWSISVADLTDDRYVVPSGREFARVIRDYYRERPLVQALGFHVANEATAPLDFGVFLKTFREYSRDYGLRADNDPILNFLMVHDDVEVSHREMGVEMVQLYTEGRADLIAQAREGVYAYMEYYGRFFSELNQALFGSSSKVRALR